MIGLAASWKVNCQVIGASLRIRKLFKKYSSYNEILKANLCFVNFKIRYRKIKTDVTEIEDPKDDIEFQPKKASG